MVGLSEDKGQGQNKGRQGPAKVHVEGSSTPTQVRPTDPGAGRARREDARPDGARAEQSRAERITAEQRPYAGRLSRTASKPRVGARYVTGWRVGGWVKWVGGWEVITGLGRVGCWSHLLIAGLMERVPTIGLADKGGLGAGPSQSRKSPCR